MRGGLSGVRILIDDLVRRRWPLCCVLSVRVLLNGIEALSRDDVVDRFETNVSNRCVCMARTRLGNNEFAQTDAS